ncbi:MAG: ABC transporter ATP-binding protein [Chloroflexota bacterium]|nr:ABC transporter ATP-binding protein [Chloroflexota bacterium]
MVRPPAQVRAVDNVSLSIGPGQSVGLVGESGCGKSTLGRLLLRLIEPTSGTVWFEGTDLTSLSTEQLRRVRRRMQMVFQDPYASLDPRKRVLDLIEEGMLAHGQTDRVENRERIVALLARVGLDERALYRYPHHFSGGQRQRIGIARALAVGARFIVADEPVSALDVSIQAQVLNLLADLREDLHLTILLVSHDLAVVHHFTDRVMVMYLGKIVEDAPSEVLYVEPKHPYTRALLDCIPSIDPARRGRMRPLAGEIPTPLHPPSGCRFHPRCPLAQPVCAQVEPPLELKADGHLAACHFA